MARSCAAWHKSVKEIAQKKKSENGNRENYGSGAVCAKTTHPCHSDPVYRRGICFLPASSRAIPRALTLRSRNDNSWNFRNYTAVKPFSKLHRSRRSVSYQSCWSDSDSIGKLKTQDHKNENRIGLRWGIRHFVRATHSAAVCRAQSKSAADSSSATPSLDSGQGPSHGQA